MTLKYNKKGFTLIEVLIAIVCLSMITIATANKWSSTIKLRGRLLKEGDFYNGIRLSISIMERDISQLFTPLASCSLMGCVNYIEEDNYMRGLGDFLRGDERITSDYWGEVVNEYGIRLSRFIGSKDNISFISSSNARVYRDSYESLFSKVSYSLEDNKDKDALDDFSGNHILVKKENKNPFSIEDKEEDFNSYYLLRGINSFEFSYYNKRQDKWVDKWDSFHRDSRHIYPDIIRLDVQIKQSPRFNYVGTYLFKPEVPFYELDATI